VMFVFTARADIGDILNGPFIFAILLGALATGFSLWSLLNLFSGET
jgi:hypothetical protein